ncbi:MAG: thioredoxin domain-containing protein [Nitrospinae bacterium]|nr:thioredoxin domain-containing protein [Nitrospinota bacterium]
MNQLGAQKSAYLKSAAHQPVDWMPWGDGVFQRARRESKPVLLDIGAVWCHWCHVMDRESYENADTAQIINERFVAVKVDRDERPDLDLRYQRMVSALSGQGGWPLTAFLTPDGKCFYGGSYFPPENMIGRPGFPTVLTKVAEFFQESRDKVDQAAQELYDALTETTPESGDQIRISSDTISAAVNHMTRGFDPLNGGFGNAPKFFHCPALMTIMALWRADKDQELGSVLRHTLRQMADGGVRDHLAGGFHRYSVDATWGVPHFEKMAYDNADLLKIYSAAYSATGEEKFLDAARETARFTRETLMDPAGGFYASQDADINLDDDGDHYTWSAAEAAAALSGDELEIVRRRYGLREQGDMGHDPARCVLRVVEPFESIAAAMKIKQGEVERTFGNARRKMIEARAKRKMPFVDTTMYTNWNGMFISAFLAAGGFLGDYTLWQDARRAFDRFATDNNNFVSGVARSLGSGAAGLLDDYACMLMAALDMYETSGETKYLEQAMSIRKAAWEKFGDPVGGYFDAESGADPIVSANRVKPTQDAPSPSPVMTMAYGDFRLYHHIGARELEESARMALNLVSKDSVQHALFYASSIHLMDFIMSDSCQITVAEGDKAARMLKAAKGVYMPHLVIKRAGVFSAALPEGAGALVCYRGTCHPPVNSPEELTALLRSL